MDDLIKRGRLREAQDLALQARQAALEGMHKKAEDLRRQMEAIYNELELQEAGQAESDQVVAPGPRA